ncbi:MAG: hypothetical protein EAX90_00795 [Candidatus Heimdallarchaeota archaeon]|nr:hypothetical protein [Candidatus Heimdallarchaeota archaeon]
MSKKVEPPKTIKIGSERFTLLGGYNTRGEARKKAEWHRYKGKKVRIRKIGSKFYNYGKNK